MNRCDVEEEQTTAGANALNLVPLPLPGTTNASVGLLPDANVTAPLPGAVQSNSLLNQIPKIKKEHRGGTDITHPLKKKEKASLKSNLETTSYGSGGVGVVSRSADYTVEKHKFKHQNLGRSSDGGLLLFPFSTPRPSNSFSTISKTRRPELTKSCTISDFIYLECLQCIAREKTN
jgi:hypothetical protein